MPVKKYIAHALFMSSLLFPAAVSALEISGSFVRLDDKGKPLARGEILGPPEITSSKKTVNLPPELQKKMLEAARKNEKKQPPAQPDSKNHAAKEPAAPEKKNNPSTDFVRADGSLDLTKKLPASWKEDTTDKGVIEVAQGQSGFDMRPSSAPARTSALRETDIPGGRKEPALPSRDKPQHTREKPKVPAAAPVSGSPRNADKAPSRAANPAPQPRVQTAVAAAPVKPAPSHPASETASTQDASPEITADTGQQVAARGIEVGGGLQDALRERNSLRFSRRARSGLF